jgi:hypothetical protein
MPICNLVVRGKNFDIEKYIKSSLFKKNAKIFHQGDFGIGSRILTDSGFSLLINDSEESIDVFFQKIYQNLELFEKEFFVLNTSYEIQELELHIGFFWEESTVCFSVTLPPNILLFTGKNSISIVINTYATSSQE